MRRIEDFYEEVEVIDEAIRGFWLRWTELEPNTWEEDKKVVQLTLLLRRTINGQEKQLPIMSKAVVFDAHITPPRLKACMKHDIAQLIRELADSLDEEYMNRRKRQ